MFARICVFIRKNVYTSKREREREMFVVRVSVGTRKSLGDAVDQARPFYNLKGHFSRAVTS